MKKIICLAVTGALILSLAACGTDAGTQANRSQQGAEQSVSQEAAAPGTREKETPGDILEQIDGKRTIENGTKVTLTIGDVVIPATLNDSRSAQDLISRLPYTVPLYDYTDDYCATMREPLEYDEADKHRGWMTGDIDFVLPAEWFVLLFNQNGLETTSTWHINLGTIDGDLSVFDDLPGNIDVLIELAEDAQTGPGVSQTSDAGNVIEFEKRHGLEMLSVEGGSYTMGSNEENRQGDETEHEVSVGNFYMSSTETTQGLYEAITGVNPSYYKGDNLPVEQVSWYSAVEFCNLLSEQAGLTPCYTINKENKDTGNLNDTDGLRWSVTCDWSANGYRLPTEAEWEYAAKGGKNHDSFIYPGSNDIEKVAQYSLNSNGKTNEVALKEPNSLGIYDMGGNVFEWCWDWYGTYPDGAVRNTYGAGSGMYRVLRGGSWFGDAFNCRAANRHYYWPFFTQLNLGFRVVRNAD